jgi:molybdopterin-guanine dinucleotide biosynthesis protein A
MRGLVLAGGKGSRLRTQQGRVKPLVTVGGVALLERAVRNWSTWESMRWSWRWGIGPMVAGLSVRVLQGAEAEWSQRPPRTCRSASPSPP